MSDTHAWTSGDPADDPFAPNVVEATIVQSLRPSSAATPTTQLVRTLADAYVLPQAADAALARSRATLLHRATALDTARQLKGRHAMIASDTSSVPTTSTHTPRPLRPPQRPPRRLSPFAAALRTAAAILIVALLGTGFYALLHSMQHSGTKPPVAATATPSASPATPSAPTSTTIPQQPPAPAGVYVTVPGTLFLLDPSTGAIRQRYAVPSSLQTVVGAPAVANGVVYFTTGDTVSPWEDDVVALSASSGAQLWRTQTVGDLQQLTLTGGTLYGGTEGTTTGTDTLYALRASDGSVRWTFHTATLRPPAVVAGETVYVIDQPANSSVQHVHALRASDGSQLWDTPLQQGCSAPQAVVDQGMVFVACSAPSDFGQGGNGSVYGLRASDGSVAWQKPTNGEPGGMAAEAGLVYISAGGKNAAGTNVSGLFALDASSGAMHWQIPNGVGWPVVNGTRVYAELGGDLAAFSALSGAVLWTYPWANQRIEMNPPVVTAGADVYAILNEQVVEISAANGSVLWRSPTLGSQQQAPAGLSVVTGS